MKTPPTIEVINMINAEKKIDPTFRTEISAKPWKLTDLETIIFQVLHFIRNHKYEIPRIYHYHKDKLLNPAITDFREMQNEQPLFTQAELFKIYRYDEKWLRLKKRKTIIKNLMENLKSQQEEDEASYPPGESAPNNYRKITQDDMDRIEQINNVDDIQDMNDMIRLYYSDM